MFSPENTGLSWAFTDSHFPQRSSPLRPSPVLRHGAKSGLSHQPPSWEDGSTKCHLFWQGSQVRCDCAGVGLSEPEFPIRHRDEKWICRTRMGKLFWSILLLDITAFLRSCCLYLLSAHLLPFMILDPAYFTFLPFCWYLTRWDFVFCNPWHCFFFSQLLERRAKRG